MEVTEILSRLQYLGVEVKADGDNLLLVPGSRVPTDLVSAIRGSKAEVLSRLADDFEPWMLWEWRRISIPEWRRILSESMKRADHRREKYARWMLAEVLLDPEDEEPHR